ncbi:uncharacterized protein LOC141528324 isoform X2 [Cotesia typhae]|uniref:uncharacterized protein LOC141528324 isoform X2 n=1 Tax=Cotesia typhae TaxID=2053667 RepID=UPI003D683321
MGNEKRITKTTYTSTSAKNDCRSIIDVSEVDHFDYDNSEIDNSSSVNSLSPNTMQTSITRLIASKSIALARYSIENLSIKLTLGNLGFLIIIMVIFVPKTITYFLIYPIFRLLFGTLYPAYASYKAVRTKNVKEYVKWMMYWIVFALFTCAETFTDVFFSFWFPFYYEIKIILVIWLLSPATKGSSILYRRFVHPALIRREAEIDDALARATEQGYTAVLHLGTKGVNYATTVLMQTAIKGGGGLVQQLKKSYSLSDLTSEKEDENRNTSMMHDETDMIEPRRRENPGRRGYSPRRTQSSCNRVDMFFSEVDVDVRQPRPREPISSLNNIRSSDDISSGYSSGEAVQNHRMTPHTETLLRTSSVGARTRSSKPRSTAKKLPEDEENTCELVDPQLPALSVITAHQSLQLMLYLSQMHGNAPLNYPGLDEILRNSGDLFLKNFSGSIQDNVNPNANDDANGLQINEVECDYKKTDREFKEQSIDFQTVKDIEKLSVTEDFCKIDDKNQEEIKKNSSSENSSKFCSVEFEKLNNLEKNSEENLSKLIPTKSAEVINLLTEEEIKKLSSGDSKDPPKLIEKNDLINSEELKKNSSVNFLQNNSSGLSIPKELKKLSSSHEILKSTPFTEEKLPGSSISNVDITKITDEICQEKFKELKRLLNTAHESVTSIVHPAENLPPKEEIDKRLEVKGNSKSSLRSSPSVSRSSSDCDRAGKYNKKPAPRVPSSKSQLNSDNDPAEEETDVEQALKATLVIKTGTVKTFTNVNNTKNVFFTHPTTSHRHSSPSVSKNNKKKKSLSRFLTIPRNLFGNKDKDTKDTKGVNLRSESSRSRSPSVSSQDYAANNSSNDNQDSTNNNNPDVRDILFKTAIGDQSITSDTYIDFRTDSLDQCDQNKLINDPNHFDKK